MIGPSSKGFEYLKQVVKGSNSDFCVWRKLCWEGRNHLVCPTDSRRILVTINNGEYFVMILKKNQIVNCQLYARTLIFLSDMWNQDKSA